MKSKFYLNKLGALSIITLPLFSVISCSEAPTSIVDLEIKIRPDVSDEIIKETILILNSSASSDKEKIDALDKVFIGVTSENFVNFTFSVSENDGTIILKAKEGFLFGESSSLQITITPPPPPNNGGNRS